MKTLVDVTGLLALVVKAIEGNESDRGKTHISCYETIPLINQKEKKIYKPTRMETTYKKKKKNRERTCANLKIRYIKSKSLLIVNVLEPIILLY